MANTTLKRIGTTVATLGLAALALTGCSLTGGGSSTPSGAPAKLNAPFSGVPSYGIMTSGTPSQNHYYLSYNVTGPTGIHGEVYMMEMPSRHSTSVTTLNSTSLLPNGSVTFKVGKSGTATGQLDVSDPAHPVLTLNNCQTFMSGASATDCTFTYSGK